MKHVITEKVEEGTISSPAFQHIQANAAVGVDVWVEDLTDEPDAVLHYTTP